jgi:hypothetical protein
VKHQGWFHQKYYGADLEVVAAGQEVVKILDITDGIATYRRYILNPMGLRVLWDAVPQIESIRTAPIGSLHGACNEWEWRRRLWLSQIAS